MTLYQRAITTAFAASLIGLLAACAQPELPSDHFYRLTAPQVSAGKIIIDGVLQVERLTADGVTARRAMVYSNAGAGSELREYHYHYWAEPPGIMLQDRLVSFLRSAGAAADVVTPDLRVGADYVLNGRIHRLERVIGKTLKVVLKIDLIVKRTKDDDLVLVRTYQVEKTHATDSMANAVQAFDQALAEILNNFLNDLK